MNKENKLYGKWKDIIGKYAIDLNSQVCTGQEVTGGNVIFPQKAKCEISKEGLERVDLDRCKKTDTKQLKTGLNGLIKSGQLKKSSFNINEIETIDGEKQFRVKSFCISDPIELELEFVPDGLKEKMMQFISKKWYSRYVFKKLYKIFDKI